MGRRTNTRARRARRRRRQRMRKRLSRARGPLHALPGANRHRRGLRFRPPPRCGDGRRGGGIGGGGRGGKKHSTRYFAEMIGCG